MTPEIIGLLTVVGLLFALFLLVFGLIKIFAKNDQPAASSDAAEAEQEDDVELELKGGFTYQLDNITLKFECWGEIWHSFIVVGKQQSKIDVPGCEDIGTQFWRTLNYIKADKHQQCFDLPKTL